MFAHLGPVPRLINRRTDWPRTVPVHLSETVSGVPPPEATQVFTRWDETAWHLRFEAAAARPWSTLATRDGPLWTEEVLEVFFDPVGDLESYFEVEINPLGTVTDLVLRRTESGWRKEFAWHVDGLQTRVQRTPAGWQAELSIPFASLVAEPPAAGQVWRVNFLRIARPLGPGTVADLSAWSPTGLRNFHRPERFGFLEFA